MTAAVLYRARAQLRSSRAGALLVVVLVGLSCGVTLAAVAGARRTSSAYPRMVEVTNAPEMLISPNGDGTGTEGFYDDIAALDGVRGVGPLRGIPLVFADGSERDGSMVPGATVVPLDDTLGQTIGRPKILKGRMWDPDRPDEFVVNRFFADDYDVVVGDRFTFDIPSFLDDVEPVRIDVEVVGIIATAQEIVPFTDLDGSPSGMLSPALVSQLTDAHQGFEGAAVDVADGGGAETAAVVAGIDAIVAEHEEQLPDGVFTVELSASAEQVEYSIRPLAVALVIFALVMALVIVVVIGQTLRRHVATPSSEVGALEAIGFRRSDRRAVLAIRGGLIGVTAAVVSVATAIGLSGRFPIGPARLAEPSTGIAIDLAVLVPGAFVVLAFCVVACVTSPERQSRTALELVTPASRLKLSPPAAAGLRAAWPARATGGLSVIVAGVVGVVAVLAATTFSASLDNLVDRPAHYGQSWDRMVDGQFGPAPLGEVFDRFEDDDRVTAIAVGDYGEAVIGDTRIPAISWDTMKGDVDLVAIEGRTAITDGEIALGGQTLDDLDLDVGDSVDADVGRGTESFRIVGELVFPRLGLGSFATTGLGVGAQLHVDSMPPLSVPPPEGTSELPPLLVHEGRIFNFAALTVAEGESIDTDLDEISALGDDAVGESFQYRTSQRPTTIADLERVRSVPALLAVALAGLAAATLAHGLASSIRARRRELSVLAALGFQRRHLAATVLWHALAVALVAVVIAGPIGAAAGRLAWQTFAGEFYVPDNPIVPIPAFALVAAVAFVVAVAAALPFAAAASRTRPSTALRTE